MAGDMAIPKANMADFSKNAIIKSKQPLTKDQIDTQCREKAMFGRGVGSTWEGVDLGTTQKRSIFGLGPEKTTYNYGCRSTEN